RICNRHKTVIRACPTACHDHVAAAGHRDRSAVKDGDWCLVTIGSDPQRHATLGADRSRAEYEQAGGNQHEQKESDGKSVALQTLREVRCARGWRESVWSA